MEILKKYASDIKINLNDKAVNHFNNYMDKVLEWNEKINLTSITDKDEFVVKHFCDSLSLFSAVDIKTGAKVIDIGTGAGFPGVPMKIARPDINLTLLDSLNKRINFLNDIVLLSDELKSEAIHGRAEDFSKLNEYREKYDIAVSRAVANLAALTEYCLPFVKVGGYFVSMKGPEYKEELENAKKAIDILGGTLEDVISLTLPDGSMRTIIKIKKIKNTPAKYPRRGVKINKSPLS
ncbi:MAG: 16S rRNA (guanine(527)-N(7))-methyltransferase RsmG [Acutalibacteraceae bacterium]|nr:16S rRNA (guanine(527)-N(7))-methyltransferase RsmG [Acutalibacteraceae bacterium]